MSDRLRLERRPERKCPLWLMGLTGVVAIGLQLPGSLPLAALGLALLLGLFAVTERSLLRMVGNPRFWVIGLTIAALSGLFLGKRHGEWHGLPISIDGFTTGILIVFRMGIMVSLIMGLSRKITPDRMVRAFSRIGFPQAGGAFALGVELLPQMMKGWRRGFGRNVKGGPTERLARMVAYAADLADEIGRDASVWSAPRRAAKLFIVSGPPGSGKSRLLETLVTRLSEAGYPPGGFIQPSLFGPGAEAGYDLAFLPDGPRLSLARGGERGSGKRWTFDETVFARAAVHLEMDTHSRKVWIVDEIGRLEVRGEGHWPILARTLPSQGGVWVLSVRQNMVDLVAARLGYAEHQDLLLPASEDEQARFLEEVVTAVREESSEAKLGNEKESL